MEIIHHGAVTGVTGSSHELVLDRYSSILIDCGMFQGAEAPENQNSNSQISFPVDTLCALLVTHCHIDHVGRIPHLIAAGFKGPIYCSEATAILLPLVLDDALRMGITRNRKLVARFLDLIDSRLHPLPFNQWTGVPLNRDTESRLDIRLQPAGHILGSAYIECRVKQSSHIKKVLFSGDLGAPYTPLLAAPKAPWGTDILVLESTYGDRLHEGRKERRRQLKRLVEHCFEDRGVILIPAFSIGRTQELLYELEEIIHRYAEHAAARQLPWEDLEIILDSPLAARFTHAYRKLKPYWDREAQKRVERGRHPLAFSQLTTIDTHKEHLQTVDYLAGNARPTIVIAGSGMCTGGRIVNYLKALLGDPRTDVLFVGYQASGTPGRSIQKYGPGHGYVVMDNKRINIRAGIHTLSGYSAHGDQKNLVNFVRRMRRRPEEIRLVHGDSEAKTVLKRSLEEACPECSVVIPSN